jgi:lipopolysaccharide biosynthesis protein
VPRGRRDGAARRDVTPLRKLAKALVERGGVAAAPWNVARLVRRKGISGIGRMIRYIRADRRDYALAVPFAYAIAAPRPDPSVAVVCHLFHHELTPVLAGYFRNIPFPCPIFISTDTAAKKADIERCFSAWKQGPVDVRLAPNRGRDIAPKLVAFADVHGQFEYVLHVHSKRSVHDARLDGWGEFLFKNLLGSADIVGSIFEIFSRCRNVGLVSSQHFEPLRPGLGWGDNFELAANLAVRMGVSISRIKRFDFPSGSMFWARTAALQPLLDLRLETDDFPPELGQLDGTLAHAIERLYYFGCERAGFDWIKVARRDLFGSPRRITPIDSPAAIDAFMRRRLVRLTKGRTDG